MGRIAILAPAGFALMAALAAMPACATELSAEQIVEKNVAAGGGLDAWRKVGSMVWIGHVLSANAPAPSLPFVFEFKRPNKTRFELKAPSQTAVRTYDGAQGWKLHLGRAGPPSLQPYTEAELSIARDAQGLDGPLVDYQAKGLAIALDGIEEVEGHRAYRLAITQTPGTQTSRTQTPGTQSAGVQSTGSDTSGRTHHVWIDAESFLELKSDSGLGGLAGQPGTASVFYRNYQTVEGLKLPFTIESRAGSREPDRMVIDRVVLNQPLDDRMFVKPRMADARETAPGKDSGQAARRAARPQFPGSNSFPRRNPFPVPGPSSAGAAPSASPSADPASGGAK
jgi:hypothetical protein